MLCLGLDDEADHELRRSGDSRERYVAHPGRPLALETHVTFVLAHMSRKDPNVQMSEEGLFTTVFMLLAGHSVSGVSLFLL
jgi:hypothetical protein